MDDDKRALWVGTGIALVVAAALAVVPLIAPRARGIEAPIDEFSATRAMAHVAVVAAEPHPIGSTANAAVGEYLVEQFLDLGLEVEPQSVDVPDYYGVPGETVTITNVAARLPGSASTGAVVLIAHYDSFTTTPGANDNAAAVATLIETARALTHRAPLHNDVIFLATDAEEPAPRYGATAYFNAHPWAADTAVALNFEAVGGSGPAVLVETTTPNGWLIDTYRRTVAHPAVFSFLPDLSSRLGEIGTDFDVLRSHDVPGLHFVYSRASPIYHTMQDDRDAVSRRSLQHHGEHATGLATALGSIDLGGRPPAGDVVAFTVGRRVVSYSTALGVASVVFPIVGLLAAAAVRRRRQKPRPRTVIAAGGRSLAAATIGAATGALAWTAITAVRSTPGVLEAYLWFAAMLGGTVALIARLAQRRRGAEDPIERLAGIVGVWALLAVAIGVAAPQTGYLFVWPATAGTIALVVTTLRRPGRWWQDAALTGLVAIPTCVVLLPALDIFLQFAQPRPGNPGSELIPMVAIPILLGALAIELVKGAAAAAAPQDHQAPH